MKSLQKIVLLTSLIGACFSLQADVDVSSNYSVFEGKTFIQQGVPTVSFLTFGDFQVDQFTYSITEMPRGYMWSSPKWRLYKGPAHDPILDNTYEEETPVLTWADLKKKYNCQTIFFFPCYEWLKYALTYDPNGGDGQPKVDRTDYVYTNEVAVATNLFHYTGRDFLGWSRQPEGPVEFEPGKTITGEDLNATTNGVTLYAQWEKRDMVIRLNPMDGSVTPESITAKIDETYELPTPIWTNTASSAEFIGWFTGDTAGFEIKAGDKVTREDIEVLYAHWRVTRFFNVTFQWYTETGAATNETQCVAQGEAAKPPEDSVVDQYLGHHKTGWSANYSYISSDMTINALYEENRYTLYFDANGGKGRMSSVPLKYTDFLTLPKCTFERAGFQFVGWAVEPTSREVVYTDKEMVSRLTPKNGGEFTLYAVWKGHEYTIAFDGNGALSGLMPSVEYEYGEAKALPKNQFEKSGLAFRGWLAPDKQLYADGAVVSNLTTEVGGTVTLKALWAETYYVAFDGNGATSGSMAEQAIEGGTPTPLTRNAFVRTGYVFVGWAETASGEVAWADGAEVTNLAEPAEHKKLYAIWSPITYFVAFAPNGGSGTMEKMCLTYDVPTNLPACAFKMGIYQFKEWSGLSRTFGDKESVLNLTATANETIILKAIWVKPTNDLTEAAVIGDNILLKSEAKGGAAAWSVFSGDATQGTTCVKSGAAKDARGSSIIKTDVTGPGILTFDWQAVNVTFVLGITMGVTDSQSIEMPKFEKEETNKWISVTLDLSTLTAGETYTINWTANLIENLERHEGYLLVDNIKWSPAGGPEPTPEDATTVSSVTWSDGMLKLTAASDSRFAYRVLESDDLVNWVPRADEPQAGTDGELVFGLVPSVGETKKFYKIETIKKP